MTVVEKILYPVLIILAIADCVLYASKGSMIPTACYAVTAVMWSMVFGMRLRDKN